MDAALSPPIRLQPISVTSISARSARKGIDAFSKNISPVVWLRRRHQTRRSPIS
ncbi:hypothetical protein CPB85DRAFT_268904 [Mucidula mucida]|nr:hypothetical protein CPB85DRAFT_268904 [Mucidula mucida]